MISIQLDLSDNDISSVGGRAILEALVLRHEEGLPRLQLDVSGNALPPSLMARINERCEAPLQQQQGFDPLSKGSSVWKPRTFASVGWLVDDDGGGGEGGSTKDGMLPPLRPLLRMPQSRHIVPIKESIEGGGMEARTKVSEKSERSG